MYMINTIPELLKSVKDKWAEWGTKGQPWFRGEPESATPLLPKLYRIPGLNENVLVQRFRSMAPMYSQSLPLPHRESNNEYLFIMQHTGAPTRLLDWTEGLLQALFFALQQEQVKPILWMLDPAQLNRLSAFNLPDANEFPMHWGNEQSPAHRNIQAAYLNDAGGSEYPVCFLPTYIHPRMAAQRSTFTVHGKQKVSISSINGLTHLVKFDINPASKNEIVQDLRILGFSFSSLFPDFEGLSKDLTQLPSGT